MNFELAPEAVDGFPLITIAGLITEQHLVEMGTFVRKACDDAGVKGAILDCQKIEGALSPESLYRATPAFALEVGQSIKVAYINTPSHWLPADDQFSRDIAYNRGTLLENFESLEEAVSWLQRA